MKTGERIGRLPLVAIGIILGLLLLEGALRLYAWAPERPPYIPDARLAYRSNPTVYPGHDARGWRNAAALPRADIVALGDSQTYGVNVSLEAAWPQRLGDILRRSVYQMAWLGYGPAHYIPLLDEALPLRPKAVLATYYSGNDIYDAYWFVYGIGKYQRSAPDPVVDSLATTNPKARRAIAEAERANPMEARLDYLKCDQARPGMDPAKLLYGPLTDLQEGGRQSSGTWRRRVLIVLKQSFVFQSVWPRLRPLLTPILGELSDHRPPFCIRYRDRNVHTVFSIGGRIVGLNEKDPRIAEGQRMGFLALNLVAEQCRRAGIRFYVVLIPSKEAAFRARAEPALRGESYLARAWNLEERARNAALGFFAREGIATIDTLPALEALIASGINPYRQDVESHPMGPGYDAIARAVAARLEQDGLGSR